MCKLASGTSRERRANAQGIIVANCALHLDEAFQLQLGRIMRP
jgi:hypothetical protein